MTNHGKSLVRASDIMSTIIHYIDGMASVSEAAELMREKKTTTLIVEKRGDDDAWGMIVSLDMIRGVTIAHKKPETVHVYEIMSKPIITVPAEMDIRHVAMLMNRVGIRRAPVEDGGKLVGIITQSDLVMKANLF